MVGFGAMGRQVEDRGAARAVGAMPSPVASRAPRSLMFGFSVGSGGCLSVGSSAVDGLPGGAGPVRTGEA